MLCSSISACSFLARSSDPRCSADVPGRRAVQIPLGASGGRAAPASRKDEPRPESCTASARFSRAADRWRSIAVMFRRRRIKNGRQIRKTMDDLLDLSVRRKEKGMNAEDGYVGGISLCCRIDVPFP